MNRTIVIGDPQGCYQEAIKLLEKCQAKADDWVIFAGDLVDRGPDSDKCLDLAILREQIQGRPAAILGNHEEKHLKYHYLEAAGKDPKVTIPSHIKTRAQLKSHHYDYMKRLPLFLRLPEHNAVVVHAGAYPGKPIEGQDPRHLLHAQMFRPFDDNGDPTYDYSTKWPSKIPEGQDGEGWKFWTHFWDGPERIIFGHSVLDKPLLTDKVCGIDGGCCFGHKLHAVILPDWEIVSVEAEGDYGKGSRGRSGEPIKKFVVHNDICTFS